jgi:hypothetical protein
VVKSFLIKADNICITSFVFGMTGRTLSFPGLRKQAVESFPGIDIFGNLIVIVAIQAKVTLQILGECRMTFTAVFFKFSMILDYHAWHNQCFNADCCCITTKARKYN